jgi:predicted DNA-binding protein
MEMARMFTTLQEMEDFEEAARAILKKRQGDLKMSDETVGKIAYGFLVGSRTKVQALLVGQGAGKYRKPQRMRTSDLMNLCEAVGLPFSKLVKEALDACKEKRQNKSPS